MGADPHTSSSGDAPPSSPAGSRQDESDPLACLPPAEKLHRLNVATPSGSRPFWLFSNPLSQHITRDILTGKTYPQIMKNTGRVRTIVDIGANIGAASVYFAGLYPQARMLAFEPAPDCFALLLQNTAGLTGIEAERMALFDHDGQAPLLTGAQDSVTNSFGASVETSQETREVPLREAATVMRAKGVEHIDILKIDTEGCEVPILRSLQDWLPRIATLYVEFHSAEDRLTLDALLTPSHILCIAKIPMPHRGELVYLRRDLVVTDPRQERQRIQIDGQLGREAGESPTA